MLSDPQATTSALAAAVRLRGALSAGEVLSGTWISVTNWEEGPATPMPDFAHQYLAAYRAAGGAQGTGFPTILGIEDFIPTPGEWAAAYESTLVPHCRAGGLAALLFTPTGYGTSYGPGNEGWPVMGKGTGYKLNSTWFQGVGVTTEAVEVGPATGFTGSSGVIPCDRAGSNFPTSGVLFVETTEGYAFVTYRGTGASGFTGCHCATSGAQIPVGAALADFTLLAAGTAQNAAFNRCLDDLVAQLVFLDGYGIAPLLRILWEPNQPRVSTVAWFVRTPRPYYALVWEYIRNYVTGTEAQMPYDGANGTFVTGPQAIVNSGTNWTGLPVRPVHNALWTFSVLGGQNVFGGVEPCPDPGMVDVVGFDYFAADPSEWNSLESMPGEQWLSATEYFWPGQPELAIVGFSETGIKGGSAPATQWNNALLQYRTASPAYGPVFFISWTDQSSRLGKYSATSPFDKPQFSTFWNGGVLKNLKPGAWPMAPQAVPHLVF